MSSLMAAAAGAMLTAVLSSGIPAVTDLLDRAIARTRALPPEAQNEAARMLLLFAGEDAPLIQLTPEEEADLAEADRGEFASDEEVSAILARYGA